MSTGRWWGALLLSLGLHGGLFGYVYFGTAAPDLGFDFQFPSEIEFGLTDGLEAELPGAASAAPVEPPPPPEPADGPGPSAAIADAGPPDAGRRRRRPRRDAGPRQPVAAAGEGDEGVGSGRVAFLPPGSQVALRLDLERVRASAYRDDVRALLAVLPDWNALLDGSGIDPVDDLDRVLIATPNFRRSRVVAAGRVRGGAETIRTAAATIGGEEPEWGEELGVPVAPWNDRDRTNRVVAVVGGQHFVVCRPEDLERVLAVAQARVSAGAPDPAEALLSMAPGEGLTIEAEGVRNFAANRRRQRAPIEMIPNRVRFGLSERDAGAVQLETVWRYANAEEATAAQAYWDGLRSTYAGNLIVRGLGFADMLGRAEFVAEDATVTFAVTLSPSEMRNLLERARILFERPPDPAAEPPSDAPAEPPATPTPAPVDAASPLGGVVPRGQPGGASIGGRIHPGLRR